jgi:hypothetical protein
MTLPMLGRITGALVAWAFAVYIFRVAPRDPVVRRLTGLLVLEGFVLANVLPAVFFRVDDVEWRRMWYAIHYVSDWMMLALYPPFLALALPSPVTRAFRTRTGQLVCAAIAAAGILSVIAFPGAYYGRGGFKMVPILFGIMTIMFAYGVFSGIVTWRSSTGLVRERARAFTLAFGLRDIVWAAVYAIAMLGYLNETLRGIVQPYVAPAYGFVVVLYVPMLVYGILKAHLFDIELKLKWAIKQSTVAAVFVGVFFIVSQTSATFLSQQFGNALGIVMAAILMLALRPLERMASGVANAAMPHTQPTAEYESFKKLQMYMAALEAAYEDGEPSAKKLRMLQELRTSLGIASHDAQRLEADVRAATLVPAIG